MNAICLLFEASFAYKTTLAYFPLTPPLIFSTMAIQGTTGAQLSTGRWAISFALVTTLFFTWGFTYGLLDVLNAHFQTVFGVTKLQSTLLQVAYFGAYMIFAPFGAMFMRRFGYKKGIHLGLTLYSLGAIFYWPSAVYRKYGGFVGCSFFIGCGLSCLEVAANSYICVLGSPKYAASRLNFSQGFQGIASFAGPMIASQYFFQGKNATSLANVQWVYLAVAALGLVLNIMFYISDLPEITEDALSEEMLMAGLSEPGPFYKQYKCIFGFVAQTCYIGAQVGVASFAVNFINEQGLGISKSKASLMFSLCHLTFTVGRFVSVIILRWVDPALLLSFYALCCAFFSLGISQGPGVSGIVCLFFLFFFESICYPCTFTLATKNLGVHTKRGSGLIVMGLGGGAWYPSAQGAIANRSTRHSYLVPMSGYFVVAVYAIGICIDQARNGGFRFQNIDDLDFAHDQQDIKDGGEHEREEIKITCEKLSTE